MPKANKDAHDNSLNMDEQYANADQRRPIVVFGSFQDLLGTNESGGIKAKNEFIHTDNWDLVIFDSILLTVPIIIEIRTAESGEQRH